MFFEMCKCKKCGSSLEPDSEDTIRSYQEEYEKRKIAYASEEPPEIFNYIIMKCTNGKCLNKVKTSHEEILKSISEGWSKIAWSYYMQDESNKFNFHEHFTKYIMLKGLNKFVTQKDLDNNAVLRDYVRYVEGQLTEDGED